MFTSPYPLSVSEDERSELEAMSRSRTIAAGLAQRARVILAIADGEPYPVLSARLELSTTTLTRWRKRFEARRIAGLHDAARSGRGDRLSPAMEAKILARTQQPPRRPFTHWTTRRLGTALGINHMTVQRVWQRAGLKPHRLEHYVASPDPDFEQKAADVIGLYLTRPSTRWCSASMRRRRSNRWIARCRCCRCRPVGRSAMASSTCATAPPRSTRR